jgi:hypothetical protein
MGQKEVVDGGCYLISSTAWPMNLKLAKVICPSLPDLRCSIILKLLRVQQQQIGDIAFS